MLGVAVCGGLAWMVWQSALPKAVAERATRRALSVAEAVAVETHKALGPTGLRHLRRATGAAVVAVVNRHGIVLARSGLAFGPSALDGEAATTATKGRWIGRVAMSASTTPLAAGAARVALPGAGPGASILVGVRPLPSDRTGNELLLGVESLALALVVGAGGSVLLSRWLRAHTFGLELDELTNLIREQDAMFHGIQEGVVGLDEDGRLQFANVAACGLLHLPSRFVERPATVLVPRGRVQDILVGRVAGKDLVAVQEDRILVMNRRAVTVGDRKLGYVVTLIDRTESEAMLRELDGMIGLTEALRAQAHDFSNRLHTIVGLIELGAVAEAARFATELTVRDAELADRLTREVGHPMIVALLLAKSAVAAERGVQFRLGPSTPLPDLEAPMDLLTVVGNLVDNAIEASQGRDPAWVEVQLSHAGDHLEIEVSDSGPGVPPDSLQTIFIDGYSTKSSRSGGRRGLGLALVAQLVSRQGGTISVRRRTGAVFTVVLPLPAWSAPVSSAGPGGMAEAGA